MSVYIRHVTQVLNIHENKLPNALAKTNGGNVLHQHAERSTENEATTLSESEALTRGRRKTCLTMM